MNKLGIMYEASFVLNYPGVHTSSEISGVSFYVLWWWLSGWVFRPDSEETGLREAEHSLLALLSQTPWRCI